MGLKYNETSNIDSMQSSKKSTSSVLQSNLIQSTLIRQNEYDILNGLNGGNMNMSNSSPTLKLGSPLKSSLNKFFPVSFTSPLFQTPKGKNKDENITNSDSKCADINPFTFEIPDKRLKKLLLMLRYVFSDIGNLSFYYSMQGK